jgi:hypothetical protein
MLCLVSTKPFFQPVVPNFETADFLKKLPMDYLPLVSLFLRSGFLEKFGTRSFRRGLILNTI